MSEAVALRQLLRARGSGVRIGRNASLFLWTVFLSNVGVSGIFLLLYNLYLVALGYQEDFIGLLSLVQMGAIAVGAIPTGALADRVGPRPVLIVGTLVIAVGALGMSLVASPVALALLNVVTGIGFCHRVVHPFLAVNTSPAQRTLVFSANSAAISIAGTTGSLIGGQLPALFSTVFGLGGADSIMAFRISLAFGALVGLLAAIPISRTTDKSEGPPPEVATGGTAPPLDRSPAESRRLTTLLVGATLLFAFSGALVGPFVNVYFSRVLGLSASSISFILAASSLLAAVATVAASRLADRIGTVRTMVLVRAAGAPMLILLALNPGAWLGVLAVLLRNVTDMAGWPLMAPDRNSRAARRGRYYRVACFPPGVRLPRRRSGDRPVGYERRNRSRSLQPLLPPRLPALHRPVDPSSRSQHSAWLDKHFYCGHRCLRVLIFHDGMPVFGGTRAR